MFRPIGYLPNNFQWRVAAIGTRQIARKFLVCHIGIIFKRPGGFDHIHALESVAFR